MKNILLITTIYPLPTKDNHGTAVCHFFAREWVKMGYNVQVIHYQAVYPRFFYWIARINQKRIAAKTGAVVYTHRDKDVSEYVMEGVSVIRIPLYKPIPHGRFSHKAIEESILTIIEKNKEKGVIPDVILGHFPNPQIEVLGLLKDFYPSAKTSIVMHGDIEMTKKVYGDRLPLLMEKIDMWGFRNSPDERRFKKEISNIKSPYICYSGIPAKYITLRNTHNFDGPLTKFLYVGEMIERKYPSLIIDALSSAYPNKNFSLTYIGDGRELSSINRKIDKNGIQQNVTILGKMVRDEIVKQYDEADCLIMISRGECYGLVYLEAMARGCIAIASRDEGFDGIIKNGENGFLCEAGNAKELASIIAKINSMSTSERQRISEKAIETAKWLTDENAAKMYINDVKERM